MIMTIPWGSRENGALAILGGTGPMGFLAIDYAIHNDRRPKHLVVTGRTQSKLDMAKRLYPVEEAAKYGVTLTYVLTADEDDIVEELKALTPDAKGFDDIFLMAAKERLVTQAEQLLAYDGCLNFLPVLQILNLLRRLIFTISTTMRHILSAPAEVTHRI